MWEFLIDVGGTFTDCIGKDPQNNLTHCKILSSGVIKGKVDEKSNDQIIVDATKTLPFEDFYKGFKLSLIDDHGNRLEERNVITFDHSTGVFALSQPFSIAVKPHTRYELHTNQEAPLLGIRRLLGLCLDKPIENARIHLGTTIGTNALLERKGARVALITTKGFTDLLEIGDQTRKNYLS